MANFITGIRILCGLVLIGCPIGSAWFYVFYLLGGVSDVSDGIVARRLKQETTLGARLDTIADMIFFLVVLMKIVYAVDMPPWLILWIIGIAVIKCVNILSGVILYHCFVAVHSHMNRLCGVLLFLVPLCIGSLPWEAVEIVMIATCAVSTVAAVLEGHRIRTGKGIHMKETCDISRKGKKRWDRLLTK